MKRILLTSTALVAFAGAAAADVSFTGDAELGYNEEVENGFYFSAGLFINAEAELDSGLVAGFDLDVDTDVGVEDGAFGQGDITTSDYVLYLKSDNAALYFGDTKTAGEKLFNGTLETPVYGDSYFFDKMNEDGDVADAGHAAVIRGDFSMNDWDAAVSGIVYKDADGDQQVGALQAAAAGTFGSFNVAFAASTEEADATYKPVDSKPKDHVYFDAKYGLTVGGTFGGFDASASVVRNETAEWTAYGVRASYGMGDVTVGAFFNTADLDNFDTDLSNYGLEAKYAAGGIEVMGQVTQKKRNDDTTTMVKADGSYDFSNGLVVNAGFSNTSYDAAGEEDYSTAYVGGTYDLGSDAELLVSYGWDNDDDAIYKANDEIGEPEYYEGATIAVSFEF